MTLPDLPDLIGRTLGEFVVLELIAKGGFGAVYRCEQPALKRDVVVKVLRRTDNTSVARFLREAQLLASRLDHPYAAHVYAFGVDDLTGLLWLAMELVKGVTLADWLKMHGSMPVEKFLPFFDRVAEVVQAVHELGIVHRDLKPGNLMVLERGQVLIPKLLDFGIAKVDEDRDTDRDKPDNDTEPVTEPNPRAAAVRKHDLTRAGSAIGTLPYMAPEQRGGARDVGPAADIYSLGIIAYECLTGRVPFKKPTDINPENISKVRELVPHLDQGLSGRVDDVFRTALHAHPGGRQRTVMRLAAELRAAVEAQPSEQIRSLARVWAIQGDAVLLNGGKLLEETRGAEGELERAFLTQSRRRVLRARRVGRIRLLGAAVTVLSAVVGMLWYRSALKFERAEQQARSAQQITEITISQAELEQGRAGLLHGEPGAASHLAKAYQRNNAATTAFMLSRALQPRLSEKARLASSFGRMWSAAFSPDGKQIVTADDRNAQVWDAQSYQLRFTLPHGDIVYQATYSSDGTQIITAAGDSTVRIWSVATGMLVRKFQRNNARLRYYAVTSSPDSKFVAAIDKEGALAHVWDAGTGVLRAELHSNALGYSAIAFSSDGRWLATTGGDDVRVFETRTWARAATIAGPGIATLSWDPSGPRLLTGSFDGDAAIWEVPTGKRVHHLREVGEPIDSVAFAPNGQLVVAASRDGAEQVWDATSGKLISQNNYLRSRIYSVEFDPTSTLVVAAGSNAVVVADATRGMPVAMLDGPRNVILVAHFDWSSRRVLGASWDGTVRVWDAAPPYHKWGSPPISHDCGVVTSLQPDWQFLAVSCKNHSTRVWDTGRGQLLAELPGSTAPGGDFASAYPAVSAAGDRAAVARGSSVEVYELPGGRLLRAIAHGAPVSAVAFASRSRDIVSGAVDGSLIVTRDSGARVMLPMSAEGIDAVAFLSDGRIVAADAGQRLRVYDAGGIPLADLEVSARVRMLRMSPDNRRLITVPSFTGKAAAPELWSLEHYRSIAPLQELGQEQVYSARFVTDREVMTACGDGAARLWDSATGQLRQTYRGGSRFLADATLSSDGSMVVAGGGDGQLRFWDTASGLPLWTMPAHRSHLVGVRIDGQDIVTRGFSGDVSRWTLPKPEAVIEACARARDRCSIVTK